MTESDDPTDPRCRALIDGQERVFDDLDALVRFASTAGLQATTRVSLPGRREWVPAGDVKALATAIAEQDPWAVWDVVDESASPSVAATSVRPKPRSAPAPDAVPELDLDHVDPLTSEPASPGRFVVQSRPGAKVRRSPPSAPKIPAARPLPAEAVRPIGPPTGGRGQVIVFPSQPGAPTAGAHALSPAPLEPMALPLVEMAPPVHRRSGTRWGRLVALGLVAAVFVGSLTAYVRYHAGQSFTRPLRPGAAAGVPVAGVGPALAVDPVPVAEPSLPPDLPPRLVNTVDELTLIDGELRARMRPRPQEVKVAGQLENALYVELSRMELRNLRVEAQVLNWSGRKDPIPKVAEVVIRFESRGELDRELAAIGLVMGKYVQAFSMAVPRLEAIIEGIDNVPRRQVIDGERARLFYIQRISMVEFLQGMRGR